MEAFAFREVGSLSQTEEESSGWVSPSNCLRPPEMSETMLEPYIRLSMRVDRKKVSPTMLLAHFAIEEKAALETSNRKRLSRKERLELKQSVKQFLLGQTLPTSTLYRALWNYSTGICYFFCSSKNAQNKFDKLFKDTFELELELMTPWSMACQWAIDHNAASVLKGIESSSFAKRQE